MSEATRKFFDALERHGHERLLKKTNGTIRFDLERDHEVDHWFVEIRSGAIDALVERLSKQTKDDSERRTADTRDTKRKPRTSRSA
ncbi:hypothetical protein ABZ793_32380 [Micromonospora sp. NPDC047465]|uniref:hypothetical protein n=1 Tax=Micromonospora sp. NPDC047465 TaxID=3154813 RepID=UPI0033D3ED1C